MSIAPEPILGLHADAATAEHERRLEALGRAAVRFAVTSAAAFVVVLGAFGVALWQRVDGLNSHATKGEILLIVFAFLVWLFCQLSALALGVYARRTQAGRAALVTALVPDGLLLLLIGGIYALGLLNRTVPPP